MFLLVCMPLPALGVLKLNYRMKMQWISADLAANLIKIAQCFLVFAIAIEFFL